MLDLGDLLTMQLVYASIAFAAATALLVHQAVTKQEQFRAHLLLPAAAGAVASAAVWFLIDWHWSIALPFVLFLSLSLVSVRLLADFTVAGRLVSVAYLQLLVSGTIWGIWFLSTLPISGVTRALLFVSLPAVLLMLPFNLMTVLQQWEVLLRRTWLRPTAPLPPVARVQYRPYYPKVSLHVPAYSEPPEIVIATLDALARLRYPNYEVLVIDNNTKDPALWRPVERHCRRLGPRFRFFHLESWPGAKAGALNFALTQTARDAELISIVDADYLAEPDFLACLVGYFDDPRVGFVQTPHDYRDWQDSLYLRMCYWEYQMFFKTSMLSMNEHESGITVGTMCLLRRCALEEAGGWAEWCATEDSELAIRIHALGYSSVFVNMTFGRGLIPETFAGYAKQRFRWTCGPIQETKQHVRLFLPRPWAKPSKLTPVQKLHHLNHGVDRMLVGLNILLLPLGLAAVASVIIQQEAITIPPALWLTAVVMMPANWLLQWLAYRVAVGCSFKDALGGMLATTSLSHIITIASLRALFTRRIPWHRTDKFKALPVGLAALGTTRAELMLALTSLLGGLGIIATLPPTNLRVLLLLGAVIQCLSYLVAPVLALLAEQDVLKRQQREHMSQPKTTQVPALGGSQSVFASEMVTVEA